VITINNLEVGATLQYSTNGDNGFVNSTSLIFTKFTEPMIATVPLKVADAISLALILLSSPIPFQTTEIDKPTVMKILLIA
jgi:hypothetical protein